MHVVPTIKAVMTPFPYSVTLDTPLDEARAMMEEHSIRHLPVKDAPGELVGVLSERDIQWIAGSPFYRPPDPKVLVRHACILDVCIVDLNAPLTEVLSLMIQRRIGSVLVAKEGRLAGIFTTVDACRLLAQALELGFPVDQTAA